MADDCQPPRLEDLCVLFVGTNGGRWNPEQLLGIPRHLLIPILKKFHPFDVERLEISGFFQTMGINTDHLWKGFYFDSWPRKNKWPEVYFKLKGIAKGRQGWRVCYLQRHLQDALNSRQIALSKETSCSSSEASENLQNLVATCGKYASYLRLYNSACILMAENSDIWQQLAEHIEFLEIFILRDNGVAPLCHLLQGLASKRLKSVGFCFCKVSSTQLWDKIIDSLSKGSYMYQKKVSNIEEKNMIASTQTTICVGEVLTTRGISKSNEFVEGTFNQLNFEQEEKRYSKEEPVVGSDTISDTGNCKSNDNVRCDSLYGSDDVDIYEFTDSGSALSNEQERMSMLRSTCECNTEVRQSDGSIMPSVLVDLNNDIFGHCTNCGNPTEALMESRQQLRDESSEECRISPGMSKLESPLPGLSNPSTCFLVQFELTAFWLHPDLLAFFEHTLQGWLMLETLILEDNALGFLSTPGRKFIDTLSFLCTKGRLQFLQITNNPVNDEFARRLFEKLVVAFCHKCKNRSNNTRSLTKLKFSSHQVSPAASVYLGRAIRDVCVCKLRSTCTQSAASILESVSSKSDSSAENKDITACSCIQPGSSEQECLCIGGCLTCDQADACDVAQEPQVRTKGDVTPELHIIGNKDLCAESNEDPSQDKKPLPITVCGSNTFVGIQVLKLRCVVGERGARLIADGLQGNTTLYSLSLADCDIDSAGLASIFQALSGNRYVKKLCVKGNHYDPSNNDSLAEMLASNNTLTDLNLGTCDLRGLSAKMISALCVNNTLTSLKLARNGLRDADISSLSQVFSHPSQLSKLAKLDLSFNHISPESLSVLGSSLQSIRPRKLDELKLTKRSLLSPGFQQVLVSLQSVVQHVTAEYLDRATLFADFISQM